MATPTGTLWDRDAHTAAKHDILRGYLGAWFPIVAVGFRQAGITYVDAFAGPGEYLCGSDGSPLIAMRQAFRADVRNSGAAVRMVFIEKRRDRVRHLENLIEQQFPRKYRPATHRIYAHHGSCHDLLAPALEEAGSWEGPMFVNLDGWGTDTPYSVVRYLGRAARSEVLITFARGWSLRNRTRDDDPHQLNSFYGEDDVWRELADQGTPDESRRALLGYYTERLHDAGFMHTLSFELVDENGHELLLVYATKSTKGVVKMKDAMWAVDRVHGQRFRDPRDETQLTLDIVDEPDLGLLKRQLLEVVVKRGAVTLADLKQHTLLETIYKETHTRTAIDLLEGDMRVHVDRKQGHAKTIVRPTLFA